MALTATDWDKIITARQGHLLQSWAWGELKNNFGWTATRLDAAECVVQLLFKQLPLGLTLAYLPKGPVGLDWTDHSQVQAVLSAIHTEARKRRSIFCKIEPDINVGDSTAAPATAQFIEAGFIPATSIQPRTTLIVNINQNDDDIMAAMKQKTRYNIRLATKKNVIVEQGNFADVPVFHQLAQTTANRNSFGVHSLAYYQTAHRLFAPERCALFIAKYQTEPIAALMAFSQGRQAYYLYGASANKHRRLMAPYLLQWEAIRWAKNHGCTHYDLWGIPDATPDRLEAEFNRRADGLWGVYRFKRGFGGQHVQSVGGFDYVYNRTLYRLYQAVNSGIKTVRLTGLFSRQPHAPMSDNAN